jgi:hypothetical protein
MFVLVLAGSGLAVALTISLLAGGERRKLIRVALAGVALWSVWSLYSLGRECPPGYECTGGLGMVVGLIALVGWLVGVGLAALIRRDGGIRWRWLAVVSVLATLLTASVAYQRYGYDAWRWGCPTNEELSRNQSVGDVTGAFEDAGLPLEPIPLPVWLPPREQAYRGAQALRHATPRATVYVLLCRQRCHISRFRFGEARRVGEQRWRLGMDSNNNAPIWITEADRRGGRQMLEAMTPALREVHPYIEYGSRCYIR